MPWQGVQLRLAVGEIQGIDSAFVLIEQVHPLVNLYPRVSDHSSSVERREYTFLGPVQLFLKFTRFHVRRGNCSPLQSFALYDDDD